MNTTLYHRIAAAASAALLVLLVWDHFWQEDRWAFPLIVLFCLHIGVQLLVIAAMRTPERTRLASSRTVAVSTGPRPQPASAPESTETGAAAPGPFRYGDYTLYATRTVDNGGNERTFHFFSKRTPRKGTPVPRPEGHHVGVNRVTGLPFLKRGAGPDGEVLHDARPREARQCQALTQVGRQCRNTSRHDSRYCTSHKGYHPPAAGSVTVESDTAPRNRRAVDTLPSTRHRPA